MGSPLLSSADIVGALTSPVEVRDVELWDGVVVRVRGITKRVQLALSRLDTENPDELERFQMELFRAGLVTDDETLTEDEAAEIIDQIPAGAFDKVLEAIMEVSGMADTFREGDEDRDGAGG